MSKTLTVEEFFLSKLNSNATGGLYEIEFDSATEIAIEFAKLHVEKALKAASICNEPLREFIDEVKDRILNSYPLNNII